MVWSRNGVKKRITKKKKAKPLRKRIYTSCTMFSLRSVTTLSSRQENRRESIKYFGTPFTRRYHADEANKAETAVYGCHSRDNRLCARVKFRPNRKRYVVSPLLWNGYYVAIVISNSWHLWGTGRQPSRIKLEKFSSNKLSIKFSPLKVQFSSVSSLINITTSRLHPSFVQQQ